MALKSQKDIIDSYNTRWGIKDGEKHHVGDTKVTKNFPDHLMVGETWESGDGVYKKIGENAWSMQKDRQRFSISECGRCGKYMRSKNEKNVYMQTGKCFTCHAKEETTKIGGGKEYKPPKWKSEIMFKDSFGNIIMDVNEMMEQYGNIVTHGVLTSVHENMNKLSDEERNNELHESIENKIKELEQKEGGEINHKEVKAQMDDLKNQLSKNTNRELKKNI